MTGDGANEKRDCFAYATKQRDGGCACLTPAPGRRRWCYYGECAFYKPRRAEMEAANEPYRDPPTAR